MQTASRLVFSRKRAARQEAREAAIAEHQKTMSAVKRAMDIAFRSELNMNAAFKRKREKLMNKPSSGTRDNPVYVSEYD